MTGFLYKSSTTTVSSYSRRVIHTKVRKPVRIHRSAERATNVEEKNDEIDLFYNPHRVDATA